MIIRAAMMRGAIRIVTANATVNHAAIRRKILKTGTVTAITRAGGVTRIAIRTITEIAARKIMIAGIKGINDAMSTYPSVNVHP